MEHNCTNCFYNFCNQSCETCECYQDPDDAEGRYNCWCIEMAWNLVNIGGQMKNERS